MLNLSKEELKKLVHEAVELATSKFCTKDELTAGKAVLRSEMTNMKTELRAEMADMKTELRAEMADMKAELRAEMADMKTELRAEMHQIRDQLSDQIHLGQILLEDINKTVKTMYELLLPKAEKTELIDPLTSRVETCESEIGVLNLAVKSHVSDKKLHPEC